MLWDKAYIGLTLALILSALCVFLPLVLSNLWIALSTRSVLHSELTSVPEAPVAVVLGTGPGSTLLTHRLDAAAALYLEGKVKRLLLSGDSYHPEYDEIGPMRARLIARGVPATALLVDPYGLRTYDSFWRARHVFGLKEVVVVSQRYHNGRAVFLARAHGLTAQAFNAPDELNFRITQKYLRESVARLVAAVDATLVRYTPRYPELPQQFPFPDNEPRLPGQPL